VTADIPLAFSVALANQFHVNAGGLIGKILTLALTRPASPILLVLTLFYLWVYAQHQTGAITSADNQNPHSAQIDASIA
jgi:hypothetical protein